MFRVAPFDPTPTCMGRSLTIGIHPQTTTIPKYAASPRLTMNSPTDGFGVLQLSHVLMKAVLDARLSPPTSGQNMPSVDLDVPCSVFLPKARCTSLHSAMPVVS
mmetsp:Transcript_22500/g.47398  ORF Transcript_22500/g.47398 Transcript_22500/m.47398 type:complete len:104 (+) Transcript_22500:345-656(+)